MVRPDSNRSRPCRRRRSHWRPGSSSRSNKSSAGRSPTAGPTVRAANRRAARGVARCDARRCRPLRSRRSEPGDHDALLRRQLGHDGGARGGSIAHAQHTRRGICSGTGRFRDYTVIMGSNCRSCASCSAWRSQPSASRPPDRTGWRSGWPRCTVGLVPAHGRLEDVTWTRVELERGDTEPGSLSSARLRRRAPQRGIVAALLADDEEAELVTQFSYGVLMARIPLFMFPKRSRRHCCRGCRGSPPATSSSSSGPAYAP